MTKLFTTNREVKAENRRRLKDLNQPIALVEAVNTGNAKGISSANLWGLEASIFLAVGCLIALTSNILTSAGLTNGTVGVVKEIVYEEGEQAPALPKCVWVDFGDKYTGQSFFDESWGHNGWVPICPITASVYSASEASPGGYKESTRTMLPFDVSYAWTVWKAQGQTIYGKIIIDLGKNEKEHGLTYVAFSRVRKLEDIGIVGSFTHERFLHLIGKHKKVAPRKREERRLKRLAEATRLHLNMRRQELDSDADDADMEVDAINTS